MRNKIIFLIVVFFFALGLYVISIKGPEVSPSEPVAAKMLKTIRMPFVSVGPDRYLLRAPSFVAQAHPGAIVYGFGGRPGEQFVVAETLPNRTYPEPGAAVSTVINSFRGSDPSAWEKNIPAFGSVVYRNVWPGVDVSLEQNGPGLEKIITVSPNADPKPISFSLLGVTAEKRIDGSLALRSPYGSARLSSPVAYQMIDGKRVYVDVSYELGQRAPGDVALLLEAADSSSAAPGARVSYGFTLGTYDAAYPLIIDPLLASTFVGSSDEDQPSFVFRQSSTGDIYVGGSTFGADFPTTPGALTTVAANREFFVARFSSDLSTLEAATFVGSSSDESNGNAGVLVSDGLYVAGTTFGTDFPTTPGAFQSAAISGSSHAVVFKISLDLSTLIASTYMTGTSGETYANGLLVSGSSVYISGDTNGTDLPTTSGAYLETPAGGFDGFVAKLSADLTTLEASTRIGGTGDDSRLEITLGAGGIYATGDTLSTDFPTTLGAYQVTPAGGQEFFASKLSADLTTLEASTYIGGTADEFSPTNAFGDGSLFIAGAAGPGFPVTSGAYQQAFAGGSNDAAVSRLSSDLATLEASTYIGSSGNDIVSAVPLTITASRVYVLGQTAEQDFPTTLSAFQTLSDADSMGFVAALSLDLSALEVSTLVAGSDPSGSSQTYALDFDTSGGVYVVGATSEADFPTTAGAYDQVGHPGGEVFLAHFACDFAAVCGTVPTVSTADATDLLRTSALVNGSIDSTGDNDVTTRGFVYALSLPYSATTTETGTFSTGTFSATLDGLICATTYHVAAYATNVVGTVYGADEEFTTAACAVPSNGGAVNSGPFAPVSAGIAGAGGVPGATSSVVQTDVLSGGSSGSESSTLESTITPVVMVQTVDVELFGRDLQYRDIGEDVRTLQQLLNRLGFTLGLNGAGAPGEETAYFGPRTYRSVLRFQSANDLPPSGFVGPFTRTVLGKKNK